MLILPPFGRVDGVLAVDDYVVGLAALGVPIFNRMALSWQALAHDNRRRVLVREDGSPRYLGQPDRCRCRNWSKSCSQGLLWRI